MQFNYNQMIFTRPNRPDLSILARLRLDGHKDTATGVETKSKKMEKIIITVEELDAAINAAVNAAFDAREEKHKTTLVSRKACARRLHVNLSTLWRWDRSGYLRSIKIAGRSWYSEESILRLERGERDV